MAFAVGRIPLLFSAVGFPRSTNLLRKKVVSNTGPALARTAVCSSTGAILPKPVKTSFGLVRMTIIVVPFLYLGTQISKSFAALLEEHDIFVPEDDDDDD
ncbi:single-pass membrane protein with aspartate-rich tail 1b [Polypterus senegalus]